MTTEEQFWAAVNWLKTVPDPRAKLLASQAALVGDMREALWICVEHNALHFGETHNTVVQGRAALAGAAPAAQGDGGTDIGQLGRRTVLDAIRSAYDIGYSDARNARTYPGDSAPGYKGRDVEKDHGGALIAKLNALAARPHTAAPTAQGDACDAKHIAAPDNCTVLPDGSAFATASCPLPKNHWLYAPREYEPGAEEPKELPHPILTHAHRAEVVAAVRYAIRGAAMCGKEEDFDPDALVQNAVYALCGPFEKTALSTAAQPPAGWPRASISDSCLGWTLDYKFLEKVEQLAKSRTEYSTSMEATEQVLIAALEVLAAATKAAPAAQGDALDAARYRWLAAHCRSTAEHWGGRWSIIIEGPAPKSHTSEDDFDAAIDAARTQQGHKP